MDLRHRRYTEKALVKTKIIATVGPSCESIDQLRELVHAGVDIFRLNFAHGTHEWLTGIVQSIRAISEELHRPIGILGDLSGPKIRLEELGQEEICCQTGGRFEFVRERDPRDITKLTCTYDKLIDDVRVGDRILLADGIVAMRVTEKPPENDRVVCVVEHSGCIRSRQGVNLPGAVLSTPSLTDKDRKDLAWAIEYQLDFVGLSFVRSAEDIRLLRAAIVDSGTETPPQIVAKIEKMEAVDDIEAVLDETDAVMVARGDLGVEVDITRVPTLQKKIIRLCNQHRIPVITATQMLDSMETNELPTRAEATDVANAVLDGSDAVMLSGETAIGRYSVQAVSMMSRIASEAERMVHKKQREDLSSNTRIRADLVTEAVTLGAATTAEHLNADLIIVATHSGKTAMAVSKQRSPVPILALTDRAESARQMTLYWGVTSLETDIVRALPQEIAGFAADWAIREKILNPGSRFVLVCGTDWSSAGKNVLLVHTVK